MQLSYCRRLTLIIDKQYYTTLNMYNYTCLCFVLCYAFGVLTIACRRLLLEGGLDDLGLSGEKWIKVHIHK